MSAKTMKSVSTSNMASLSPSWANFKQFDGPAGLVVFLVAMPLCLGILSGDLSPPIERRNNSVRSVLLINIQTRTRRYDSHLHWRF